MSEDKITILDASEKDSNLLRMLNRGLEDIEAGKTLPHKEAMEEIRKIRNERRSENSLPTGSLPFDVRLPRYSRETEKAMQEAKDIMSGKTSAKSYSSARELFEELDAE